MLEDTNSLDGAQFMVKFSAGFRVTNFDIDFALYINFEKHKRNMYKETIFLFHIYLMGNLFEVGEGGWWGV